MKASELLNTLSPQRSCTHRNHVPRAVRTDNWKTKFARSKVPSSEVICYRGTCRYIVGIGRCWPQGSLIRSVINKARQDQATIFSPQATPAVGSKRDPSSPSTFDTQFEVGSPRRWFFGLNQSLRHHASAMTQWWARKRTILQPHGQGFELKSHSSKFPRLGALLVVLVGKFLLWWKMFDFCRLLCCSCTWRRHQARCGCHDHASSPRSECERQARHLEMLELKGWWLGLSPKDDGFTRTLTPVMCPSTKYPGRMSAGLSGRISARYSGRMFVIFWQNIWLWYWGIISLIFWCMWPGRLYCDRRLI